jgi:hypothetical protein
MANTMHHRSGTDERQTEPDRRRAASDTRYAGQYPPGDDERHTKPDRRHPEQYFSAPDGCHPLPR